MKQQFVLEDFLPYQLNRLSSTVSEQLRGVYGRKYGLTIPEWRVMATLGTFETMTAKAIGEHSFMHKTKVSRAVDGLAKRRWLARRENPDDRREEFLSMTQIGREAFGKIVPDMKGFETKLREQLEGREAAVLQALALLEDVAGIVRVPAPSPATVARPAFLVADQA